MTKHLVSSHGHQAALNPSALLALTVALPSIFNLKLGERSGVLPTALVEPYIFKTFDTRKIVKASGTSVEPSIKQGSAMFAISNNPLCIMLEHVLVPQDQVFVYQHHFTNMREIGLKVEAVLEDHFAMDGVTAGTSGGFTTYIPFARQVCTSTYKPTPNSYASCLTEEETSVKLIWVDAHCLITIINTTGEGAGSFSLYAYDTMGLTHLRDTMHNENTTTSFFIETSAWYALRFTATTSGSHKYYISTNNIHGGEEALRPLSLVAHHPLPQLEQQFGVTSVRVTGISIQLSPTAQHLALGGRISVLQRRGEAYVPEGPFTEELGTNRSAADPLSAYPTSENFGSDMAEKGIYSFLRPTTEHSWDFTTPMRYAKGFAQLGNLDTPINFLSPIHSSSGWLYVGYDAAISPLTFTTDDGNYAAATGLLQVRTSCQIATTNMYVHSDTHGHVLTTSERERAQEILRSLPVATCNPVHIDQILNDVGNAISKGAGYVKSTLDFGLSEIPKVLQIMTAGAAMGTKF
jgi:hypothetical protein